MQWEKKHFESGKLRRLREAGKFLEIRYSDRRIPQQIQKHFQRKVEINFYASDG